MLNSVDELRQFEAVGQEKCRSAKLAETLVRNGGGLSMINGISSLMNPDKFDGDYHESFPEFVESWREILSKVNVGDDKAMVCLVLGKYVNDLGEKIRGQKNDDLKPAIDLLSAIYRYGDDEIKQKASEVLDSNIDVISAPILVGGVWHELWEYKLDRMLVGDKTGDIIGQYVKEYMDYGCREVVNSVLTNELIDNTPERVEPYIRLLAETAGVPNDIVNDIVGSWLTLNREEMENERFNYKQQLRYVVKLNLQTIRKLQRYSDPGDSDPIEGLYRVFGITNFGRYPARLLDRQWRERNDTSSDYGVWIGSYADWDGVFYVDNNIKSFKRSVVKTGMKLRVVEARGKVSVTKRIRDLVSHYGSDHKIQFMVVSGHGDSDSVQLGQYLENNDDWEVTIDDLKKGSVGRLKKFYHSQMPIVFWSCNTGALGGIADRYSAAVTDGITIGPKDTIFDIEPMNIKFVVDGEERVPKFVDVQFGGSETGLYIQGKSAEK